MTVGCVVGAHECAPWRFRLISYAGVNVSARSQEKADMVQSRRRADMRAAVEPRAEHKDTAFAGRAAGGDHCRQATVRLRQAQFRDFLGHKFLSSARRKPARSVP